MSATTERPKADPFAELEAVHEQLEEARQERARLGMESRKFADELGRADAELQQLARSDRGQFGPDGQPKPKTQAAKLRAKLDQAASSRWPDILGGADQRIREHEGEVGRLTAENAVELARREFRAGEEDLAEIDTLAERMLAKLVSLDGRRTSLMGVVAACSGRIDGRDIYSDPRLDELRSLLSGHGDFKPPRSVTLTPLQGEQPKVMRGRFGGWVGAHHGSDSHAPPEEQPERIGPNR